MQNVKKVAVIGAGWAGCSAAVTLAQAGHCVTLFEAARTLGGRARAVKIDNRLLDNGQHILLGAYKNTLKLFKNIGINSDAAMLRLPLQMQYPSNSHGMTFCAAHLPAPLHLLAAIWRAAGLTKADKLALMRFSTTARWMEWHLHEDCSVAELLTRFDQTPRTIQLLWRPLCIAALNTPPERASAQIFLNVLRDSLGARRKASDMLIPRYDLTTLFPQQAATFITKHGGEVMAGTNVNRIVSQDQHWMLEYADVTPDKSESRTIYDAVVIATSATQAASLLEALDANHSIPTFDYEPITTCYLQYDQDLKLAIPFYALIDDAEQKHWGQFVFDRGQLDQSQSGLLAVVISVANLAIENDRDTLSAAIAAQLADALSMPQLAQPKWSKVISEKRATYSCTPGLQRPQEETGLSNLVLAGDYLQSDYPATLESAVHSGIKAANLLGVSLAAT
tara:strand:+ start:9174 stop:10523 length:1350 start_codon:yes stop_codon:yes gene_type:complete